MSFWGLFKRDKALIYNFLLFVFSIIVSVFYSNYLTFFIFFIVSGNICWLLSKRVFEVKSGPKTIKNHDLVVFIACIIYLIINFYNLMAYNSIFLRTIEDSLAASFTYFAFLFNMFTNLLFIIMLGLKLVFFQKKRDDNPIWNKIMKIVIMLIVIILIIILNFAIIYYSFEIQIESYWIVDIFRKVDFKSFHEWMYFSSLTFFTVGYEDIASNRISNEFLLRHIKLFIQVEMFISYIIMVIYIPTVYSVIMSITNSELSINRPEDTEKDEH